MTFKFFLYLSANGPDFYVIYSTLLHLPPLSSTVSEDVAVFAWAVTRSNHLPRSHPLLNFYVPLTVCLLVWSLPLSVKTVRSISQQTTVGFFLCWLVCTFSNYPVCLLSCQPDLSACLLKLVSGWSQVYLLVCRPACSSLICCLLPCLHGCISAFLSPTCSLTFNYELSANCLSACLSSLLSVSASHPACLYFCLSLSSYQPVFLYICLSPLRLVFT